MNTDCQGREHGDYTPVKDCLETARNGRFCAGAESAMREIERLEAALNEIAHGAVNGMKNGGIMCRAIAKHALEPAGDSTSPDST